MHPPLPTALTRTARPRPALIRTALARTFLAGTRMALLASVAMMIGLAAPSGAAAATGVAVLVGAAAPARAVVPAVAAIPSSFHYVRGSATAGTGSVCVDAYVEPALDVYSVRLEVLLDGAQRDSVKTTPGPTKRGALTDAIKYSECFDVPEGSVRVTAVATANPDSRGGQPVTVPVLDRTLKVAAVPPPTAPAAPSMPVLRPTGGTAITVGWNAVDGRTAATGYEVRISKGASVIQTVTTTGTSTTVPGLQLGSTYAVTVRAQNSVGFSPSSPSAGITLDVPGPVKPLASAVSASSVRVDWQTPNSSSRPATTGYEVRVFSGSKLVKTADAAADSRSATVAGLEAGTRYSLDVRAKNGLGFSPSAKTSVTTEDPSAVGNWAAKNYGTFATVTHSGTGDAVVPIPRAAKAGILTAEHSGGSGFSIDVRDSRGNTIETPVYRYGAYSGSTLFGMDTWRELPTELEITASGPWTIEIRAVGTASDLPSSGYGDGVYVYSGHIRRLTVNHSGSSNFSVYSFASGPKGRDHLVNAYGAYRGNVTIKKGPAVVEVLADGEWTAKLG